MYRTDNSIKNEPTPTSFDSEEKDDDIKYKFTGATLKISGNNPDTVQQTKNMAATDSAILSGEDEPSPPGISEGGTIFARNPSAVPETTLEQQQNRQGNASIERPKVGSPKNFFSFRSGQLETAIKDCVNILLRPANDTEILGNWLLTEISHWDTERERLYILTNRTLLEIKYDFIAMRILEHTKIRLILVDKVIRGKITYPDKSLVPHIGGITNGIATILSGAGNLFTAPTATDGQFERPVYHGSVEKPQATVPASGGSEDEHGGWTVAKRFDFTAFKPIERTDIGVRIMWNKGQPISLLNSWNPFTKNIPWKTVTDHPLYSYKDPYNSLPSIQEDLDKNHAFYSVQEFYAALLKVFDVDLDNTNVNQDCQFEESPILQENYVGVGAVIHNKHNFGFFKVRGKFSF